MEIMPDKVPTLWSKGRHDKQTNEQDNNKKVKQVNLITEFD